MDHCTKNGWAERRFCSRGPTLSLRVAVLTGLLVMAVGLRAEPGQATVRVGASEGWGRVSQPWDDPASNLVGETGDPGLIELFGNQTFTTNAIREELMMSAGYLLGSHPLALREPFLRMLREKIRGGYQNGGFPDPQVEVRYDKERRRAGVKIVEGKRFRCGEILVQGVAPEVARTVVAKLTIRPGPDFNFKFPAAKKEGSDGVNFSAEIHPNAGPDPSRPFSQEAEQKIFWEIGEPVSFVELVRQELERITATAMAQHGFFFPRLEVSLQRNEEKSIANLLIKVTDSGPAAVIDEIALSGNRKNSKAEILGFLGLKTGMPITRSTLDEAGRKLWNSGRFRLYKLEPELIPAENPASRQLRLVMRVDEFDSLPKLNEELTPNQKAMLLLSQWMSGFATRGEDLVIRAEGVNDLLPIDLSGIIVLAPGKGFVMRLADPQGTGNGYAYSLCMSNSSLGIYDQLRASKLVVKDPDLRFWGFMRCVPTAPGESNTANVFLGAGFSGSRDAEKQPDRGMQFEFAFAPASFAEQADKFSGQCVVEGGHLTMTDSNLTLRVDAATGRLEEFKMYFPESGGVSNHISVQLTNGAFELAARELEIQGNSCSNRYSPTKPAGSVVGFLLGEVFRLGLSWTATNLPAAQRDRMVAGLNRLLTPDVLALDAPSTGDTNDNVFKLPMDETDLAVAQNSFLAMFSGLVFRYCNDWFPKYSWPWSLARESVLVLASKGVFVEGELDRLSRSEDTGPLGSLVTAYLVGKVNPSAGRAFATRGLTRLSVTDFNADCRLFLEGDSGLARTFANIAANLRKMPEDEFEALVATLPPGEAAFLRDAAKALRQSPDQPLSKVLSPGLETYWNTSLRKIIRAKLLKLTVELQGPPRTGNEL